MAGAREIKGRIRAVANIKRITKTMQMIATSKFAKAQAKAVQAKPYVEGVFGLVQEVAATAGDIDHPLINGPEHLSSAELAQKPHVFLVLTSDRGLCGPYNGSVIRTAIRNIRAHSGPTDAEVVGKKGVSVLRFNKIPVETHYTHFGDTPRREDIDHLADDYMKRFTAGEISGVTVVYMRFVSAGRQTPEALQLLPLKPPATGDEAEQGAGSLYEFMPDAEELLAELLPVTVRATLNQCFSDAIVSEHVARMVAMKAATDNAGRMGKDLKRVYNRARQAQITTELTEIISGVAALE
jgi:F-type H+-transporting ATPase subunit gamma